MSLSPAPFKQAKAGLAAFAMSAMFAGLIPALSVPGQALAQSCTVVSSANLAGYWKFDENTGTTTADSSGNGHTGTLINGPMWSSGATVITPNPSALKFDGTNDYVTTATGASSLAFGSGSFTVSLFSKASTGNKGILGNFNGTNRGWGLYYYASNQINFFGYGNTGINDTGTPAPALLNNQWHHVAGVFTRSGSSLKIDTYYDGTFIGTNTSNVGDITSVSPLTFGRYIGQPYLNGSLDDIRVYGRSLSAGEVASLASNCNSSSSSSSSVSSVSSSSSSLSSSTGSSLSSSSLSSTGSSLSSSSSSVGACTTVPLTGLSAYWKFDETSGVANDSTGFNNSGSLLNGAARSASGAPVNYANPRSLSLDGTDDYVLVPNTTNIASGTSARSISLWVKPDSLTGYAPLVSLGNGSSSSQKFIFMLGNLSGQNYAFTDAVNGLNNVTLSGSQVPSTGAWHNVAFVFNGSGGYSYYLDGMLKKSGTFPIGINTNTNDVEIGGRHDAVTGYFDGLIDEVRVYNRALNAGEVSNFAGGCGNTGQTSSSSSSSNSTSSSTTSSSSSSSSVSSSISSSSSSSSTAIPQCEGQNATIYVRNGKIVGGTQSGATFMGFLNGTNGNDVMVGTAGNDYIRGNNGADVLCARGGNDYVNGDSGNDTIRGGAGSDYLYGGEGTDTISGNGDNDSVFGGDGADVLCGNAGGDYLQGQDAADQIDGGAGSDNIFGGSGSDSCASGDFTNSCEQSVSSVAACSNNNE